jgi:hypothetical protein
MGNTIGGRHCIRYKNVQTGEGATRRVCAKYGEIGSDELEHSGAFGNLGRFVPTALKGSKDSLVGVGIGLAGVAALKFAVPRFLPANVLAMIPSPVLKALPTIGGAVAGTIAYGATRNKAYALGALGAGVTLNAWDLLSEQFPALGSLVTYSIPGYGGYGLLQPEASRQGAPGQYGSYAALIDDPRPGMSELAAMSLGNEEEAAP